MAASTPRFTPGANVAWRSMQADHVGYVLAASVIVDTDDIIAIHQPAGAPILRRGGERTGPRGRGLAPGAWDGTHRHATFNSDHDVVRAHQPGRYYSVIRKLTPDGYSGWYINLELPWTLTPIGYDSKDLTLDIVLNDDLTNPQWKDLDEHNWNLTVGNITADEHRRYLDHGNNAIADAANRQGVFGHNWPTPATQPAHPLLIPPNAIEFPHNLTVARSA